MDIAWFVDNSVGGKDINFEMDEFGRPQPVP
eukprot:SAG22_NODE_6350_length_867_cov_0.946615_2_plen_30_part_01